MLRPATGRLIPETASAHWLSHAPHTYVQGGGRSCSTTYSKLGRQAGRIQFPIYPNIKICVTIVFYGQTFSPIVVVSVELLEELLLAADAAAVLGLPRDPGGDGHNQGVAVCVEVPWPTPAQEETIVRGADPILDIARGALRKKTQLIVLYIIMKCFLAC